MGRGRVGGGRGGGGAWANVSYLVFLLLNNNHMKVSPGLPVIHILQKNYN